MDATNRDSACSFVVHTAKQVRSASQRAGLIAQSTCHDLLLYRCHSESAILTISQFQTNSQACKRYMQQEKEKKKKETHSLKQTSVRSGAECAYSSLYTAKLQALTPVAVSVADT